VGKYIIEVQELDLRMYLEAIPDSDFHTYTKHAGEAHRFDTKAEAVFLVRLKEEEYNMYREENPLKVVPYE